MNILGRATQRQQNVSPLQIHFFLQEVANVFQKKYSKHHKIIFKKSCSTHKTNSFFVTQTHTMRRRFLKANFTCSIFALIFFCCKNFFTVVEIFLVTFKFFKLGMYHSAKQNHLTKMSIF